MSEIEAFPRAVLKHHYPEVPLHGDFTTIQAGEYQPIDVLVGGTPCQSFSVAGLRGGIADSRGNLALEFIRLAQRLQPRWIVWENVPGVLSSLSHDAPDPRSPPNGLDVVDGTEWVGEDEYDADESHAFACFLAGLSAIGYGWAYRIFDAQYAGLAQRRERVFVVASPGDWRGPSEVLSLREGLRWHPAPSRETRERVAASLTRGADSSGKGGYAGRRREDDENLAYGISPDCFDRSGEASTGTAAGRSGLGVEANLAYAIRAKRPGGVAMSLNAHGGSGRMDGESETFIADLRNGTLDRDITMALQSGGMGEDRGLCPNAIPHIVHSLRADGFDASEDGTGRGTPLVPTFLHANKGRPAGRKSAHTEMVTLETETIPTLATDGHQQSAIAFQTSQSGVRDHETHATLDANNGSRRHNGAIVGSAVRRLTPRECCRLQGFPDDYLDITYRGKPAADSPKYRALGNSFAVPVVRWIGERIARQ